MFSRKNIIWGIIFFATGAGVVWAVHERLVHAYLEDDMLWFLPLLTQMMARFHFGPFVEQLHSAELTLVDGAYFASLVSLSGVRLALFTWISIGLHFLNALLLFSLLRNRLRLGAWSSLGASLIYLAFYGHFHAYTFLMAFHHLAVVFFFLLILHFYLWTDDRMEQGRPFHIPYGITLLLCLPAAVQRLSILILPLMIFIHLLYTTSAKEKVLVKFKRWIPLFAIFLSYQTAVFLMGTQGDVLDRFLEPFYDFGTSGRLTSLTFLAVVVVILLLCLFAVWFLKFCLNRWPLERLQRSIFYGVCLTVFLFPLMTLCVSLFLRPVDSALAGGFLPDRWQRMENPVQGLGLWGAWGLTVGMLLCGLRYVKTRCPHFIIFFIWFAALNVYFVGDKEQITSRYLVYLSPVFAVLLVILFWEIFPRRFSPFLRRWYGIFLAAFLGFMLAQNLLAIKLRSVETLLTDYHWSYDYIKAANLIQQDMERRFGPGTRGPTGICVDGIRPIPYLDNWRQGFLKDFPPETLDPFKQILYSIRGGRLIAVDSGDACPPGAVHYTLTDTTVTTDGKSVEQFYVYFNEGLRSLQQSAAPQASQALRRAVREKPFLFRFLDAPAEFRRWGWADIFRKNTASVIYGIYGSTYDPDGKMRYIDTMIRRETYDYGLALVLSAYLENARTGETADGLLKEAALYVTRRGLEDYLRECDVSFPGIEDFRAFLQGRASRFLEEYREPAWEDVENYRGFRIYSYRQFYFAQPAQEGSFDLARYKSGLCPSCAAARTKREVRRAIAPRMLPESSSDKNEPQMVSRQGQYIIFRLADAFYVLAQEDVSGSADGGAVIARAMFRCTTLAEAKASILLAESFPDTAASGYRRLPGRTALAPDASLAYRISWLGLDIGRLSIQTGPAVYEGRQVIEEKVGLRPPAWLLFLSSGKIGLDLSSMTDPDTRLPYVYTQTDLYSHRKGKALRRVLYHHDQLFMERKQQQEDILSDTRDLASVTGWLAAQDYSGRRWIKTTFNINRTLYLLVGRVYALPAQNGSPVVRVDLNIQRFAPSEPSAPVLPVRVYLVKTGDRYAPAVVLVGRGMRSIKLVLAGG